MLTSSFRKFWRQSIGLQVEKCEEARTTYPDPVFANSLGYTEASYVEIRKKNVQNRPELIVSGLGYPAMGLDIARGCPRCVSAMRRYCRGLRPVVLDDRLPPQAIQGIVNTLFWLYCGFNFSESKIILIHKAVLYIVIPIAHAYYCLPHSPVRQIVFSKPILYYTIEYQGWGNRVPNLPFL